MSLELTGNSVTKDAQKHGEVDWPWSFAKHLLQVGVLDQAAKSVPGNCQISFVDDSILVGIDEREGLLKFSNLVLGEHREDI